MTIAELTSTGRGTVQYRLMVEGWPEMFVTHPSITATSIADSRTVIAGLQYEGLQIHDRIIPGEAKIQATGNTFKIKTTYGSDTTDPVLASLSIYPEPVAALGTSLSSSAVTLAIVGGGSLSNSTNYHLGTEVVRVGTWPTITRTKWDTQAQAHHLELFDQTKAVYIYTRPPTMEGRRCYLYAYGNGDTLTGAGTLWWRGIVSRAPKLDADCVTWVIEALPITHVLKQNVAGDTTETHPVGIYHNSMCTFGFYAEVGPADPPQRTVIYRYPGNDVGETDVPIDTEDTFIDAINALIAQMITDYSITVVDSITLVKDPGSASKFSFAVRTGAVGTAFRICGGSPLLGWCDTFHFGWFARAGDGGADIGMSRWDVLTENTTWMAPLEFHNEGYAYPGNQYQYDGGGVAAPIGNAALAFKEGPPVDGFNPGQLFKHTTVGGGVSLFTPWRIHTDLDVSDATTIHVEGSIKDGGNFRTSGGGATAKEVAGVTADFNYVTLEQISQTWPVGAFGTPEEMLGFYSRQKGFFGILLAASTITPIRYYGWGSVTTFVTNLKSMAVNANDGDVPFITDADLGDWVLLGDVLSNNVTARQYAFTRPKSLEAILAEECKLAGHLMRIESDGRIGIIPLPLVTDTFPVDDTHTIDGSDIITPHGGAGSWPLVEPQRDGFVTTLSMQEDYDAVRDDWRDTPKVFQDADAVATHKNRGKTLMEIKPYSRLSAISDKGYVRLLATRILSFFARDYLVVTIEVPFSKFNILCGDTVSLTHRLIPDGTGLRGITARRGVVIERRWNLDPGGGEKHGMLTIWINGQPLAGYAPGGLITGEADMGSNLWVLTLSSANDYNIQVSTNGDGEVLEHFAAGYVVRAVQTDTTSPSSQTGTVISVDLANDQIQIQFDGAVSLGTGEWYLEFSLETDCTTAQRKYAFVADGALHRAGNAFARRLA